MLHNEIIGGLHPAGWDFTPFSGTSYLYFVDILEILYFMLQKCDVNTANESASPERAAESRSCASRI